MRITHSGLVTVLAFFIAASQVIEAQLPVLPMSFEEIGIVLTAGMLLVFGFPFRFSALLVALFGVLFVSDAIYPLVHGQMGQVAFKLASNGALFVAFSALHEKLAQDPRRFLRALALSWIGLAALSSVVIVMQLAGILPQAAWVQGAVKVFPRPPGLQNDPNYAAYSIALAMMFLFLVRLSPRAKLALGGLLLIGAVGTDSRMGMVLILLVWIYFWLSGWGRLRAGVAMTRLSLAMLALMGGVGGSLMSSSSNVELLSRFENAAEMIETISFEELSRTRGYQTESSRERLLLAYAGLMVWQDNPWLGVGQDRVVDEIRRKVRVRKPSHNAYVDRLAIGGVGGIAYILFICYLLLRAGSLGERCDPLLRDAGRVSLILIAVGSFFLNLSPWLPTCLISAAIWSASTSRTRPGGAAPASGPISGPGQGPGQGPRLAAAGPALDKR